MRAVLIAVLTALLCACNTQPDRIERVEIEVAKPCIKKAPTRPAYRFGRGSKPASDVEMAKLLARDFEAAEQYGYAWEAAAAGCIITAE